MGRIGKYTEEFKKKVAKDRVENSLSVKETAKNTDSRTAPSASGQICSTIRQNIVPTWLTNVQKR